MANEAAVFARQLREIDPIALAVLVSDCIRERDAFAAALAHYHVWFGDDCRCEDGECPIPDALLAAEAAASGGS